MTVHEGLSLYAVYALLFHLYRGVLLEAFSSRKIIRKFDLGNILPICFIRELHGGCRNVKNIELICKVLNNGAILTQVRLINQNLVNRAPSQVQPLCVYIRSRRNRKQGDLSLCQSLDVLKQAAFTRFQIVIAVPSLPARPVLPMRWTYVSAEEGIPKLMT